MVSSGCAHDMHRALFTVTKKTLGHATATRAAASIDVRPERANDGISCTMIERDFSPMRCGA